MSNNCQTLNYLIAMLKAYHIKYIVASPGARNSVFNSFVQEEPEFICQSVIDERSAAYVGLGMARESDSAVVLSCTGATASRNYISALTEAYYSQTPLIALTFCPYTFNPFNMSPQYVDRSISQNDIKALSVELPLIKDDEDKVRFLTLINAALSTAIYKKMPVHINCPSFYDYSYDRTMPEDIWVTKYYRSNFSDVKKCLEYKNCAIFIGQHRPFTKEEENSIENFAKSWNLPVFCDHTSNYNGENKILTSQYSGMYRFSGNLDLIIDIGNISGDYTHCALYKKAVVWRVTEDGSFKCRNSRPVTKTFYCEEKFFFETMANNEGIKTNNYYKEVLSKINKLKYPNLPFCNAFICQNLAKNIPNNAVLHLSILNSFRNMNFFNLNKSISSSCNVGGFGIDGPVSTLVGQSLINPNKKYFGLFGDLSFFYDMNAIGIRNIGNNLRILLINNSKGVEFRLASKMEYSLNDKIDNLIAAAGHNKGGAKGWAESCGFKYMSTNNKDEFLNQINGFCNDECDKPILFEVFTTTEDEQNGLKAIQNHNRDKIQEAIIDCYKKVTK